MTKARWALVALLLSPALPALAQPAPTLRIDRQVGALHELALEAGQNRLLVLSEPVARVSVADPTVADLKVVTNTQLLLTAKGVGSTDLTLWNKNDEPLVVALQVARYLEGLRKQLRELFPKEQITVHSAGDLVILSGSVSDVRLPERIGELAKLHSGKVANLVQVTGEQQVQLEVKFAEVSRTGLREIGLNFFHKSSDGYHVGGLASSRTIAGDFLNTVENPAIPGTGPRGQAGAYGGQPPDVLHQPFGNAFSIFYSGFSGFPFSVMLSLLESSGLAKVLAEPTLVTLSGQEAKFLAGGEFPVPLSSALGQVNVQWKKFGILLGFTPTVLDRDTIHLKLAAEVSDIDPKVSITVGGNTIPGLTSRQSETTVRLADGQSFAVAGLMSDTIRSQIDQVPLLGDLPIIGALFRSTNYQRLETELLVIVTARLAKPVAPHELPPLPTSDEDNNPSDFELFMLGTDTAERRDIPRATGGPTGAAGFSP